MFSLSDFNTLVHFNILRFPIKGFNNNFYVPKYLSAQNDNVSNLLNYVSAQICKNTFTLNMAETMRVKSRIVPLHLKFQRYENMLYKHIHPMYYEQRDFIQEDFMQKRVSSLFYFLL